MERANCTTQCNIAARRAQAKHYATANTYTCPQLISTRLAEVAEQELARLGNGLAQRLEGQRLAALVLRHDAAALVGAAGRAGGEMRFVGKVTGKLTC